MSPEWTDGDTFVYIGYDTFAIETMNQYLANGSTPESVDRIGNDRLTTRYNGNDDCTRTAWDGECSKATQTHEIELIANWTNQSTLFESDQLFVKINTDRQVWEPVDRIGIISPFTDVKTITLFMVNFTVGSEQNSVEVEATIWSNSTRSGDWPEQFRTGDSWTLEEETETTTSIRTRENGGPWNETEKVTTSEVISSIWTAGEESDIYVGEGSQIKESTTVVTIEETGGLRSDKLWVHDEGYVLQQESRIDGKVTLVLQVIEWSYNYEDARNVQVTGSDRTGTIFAFILVGIALATILGWVGFRAYNIVKEADYIDNIAEKVVDLDRNIREKGRDSEANQPRGLLSRDTEISDEIDNL
ncbi:MAG: hypothetical protein CMB17_03455 [Euryarchaeota archaeon]|nr:hypothetical protein [Euryarchaeota archaeon]|tara:strand:+ start:238 stop:1314 length:1077 start_codon:yes stop_codon:yes gene_type:complete